MLHESTPEPAADRSGEALQKQVEIGRLRSRLSGVLIIFLSASSSAGAQKNCNLKDSALKQFIQLIHDLLA